MIEDI